MKNYYTAAILTLVLVCLSHSLFAQGLADDPRATGVPVGSLLKPDGTLDLTTGFTGSLDVSGFRMETGRDGNPRFIPDLAGQSGSSPAGPMDLQGTLSHDDEFWASGFHLGGINGNVRALAVIGSDLYAGGSFTTAGEIAANNIAKWDGENWSALGSGLNATALALAVIDNNLYAGGSFTRAGGRDANYIAKWDGENWTQLGFGMNDAVLALTVIGNDLYVGGLFTIAGDINANRIAKWNESSWSTFGSGMSHGVYAIAAIGSEIYAAGEFLSAGGTAIKGLAKWNGASWSALGSGMGGNYPYVFSLAVIGNDLYAGGMFTSAGGRTANRIAKWNGSSWSALGTGMNITGNAIPYPSTLVVNGSDLYAGGMFTSAGGIPANYIAKWDGDKWTGLSSGMNSGVSALVFLGDTLFAGGRFNTAGGVPANRITKWDGDSWLPLGTQGSGMNGNVRALAVIGSDLYAGGEFEAPANYIAKWDGLSWAALGSGMNGEVRALAVKGNDLYAGGSFTTAGGVTVNHIAKWDGEKWSALGSGIGGVTNPVVVSLVVSGSDLYAGGFFTTAGAVTVNHIAKWDGDKWTALGTGMGSSVSSLALIGSDLYAGGIFTTAGGVTVNRIAKWNGTSWSALGAGIDGISPSIYVHDLAVMGNTLYVGGRFTRAGTTQVDNIAKWDGEKWSALGSGMSGADFTNVYAFAVHGSDLYAGGNFTTAGGTVVNRIAKWDGESWSALGSGMDAGINALAITGSNLYAGGWFTTAGVTSSGRIARWFKPVAAAAVTRTFMTPQDNPLSFNEQDAVTGVSMQINSESGGPTVHVLRYDDAPHNPDGIRQDVSQFRWIIQQIGIGPDFNATVRFKLSDIPNHGISDPASVIVYRRRAPGTGTFNMYTTQYDAENDELVIKDIWQFGEFAFGNITVDAENQEDGFEVPGEYQLSQNYPNPFNPATTIEFSLPQPGMVMLTVYNMLGQKVATLASGELQAGSHSYQLDASEMSSGIYLYRLSASGHTLSRHMTLIR